VFRENKVNFWFAPNVGLVKHTNSISDRVTELKEFKRGK
jgi:hypothetical protein